MSGLRLVPASGDPIEITQDQAMVGRDPGCDVVLNDGSVSRKHAILQRRGSEWAVVDQGSANGTFLDSQKITDTILKAGQELRFGAIAFKVALAGGLPVSDEPGATLIQAVPLAQVTRPMPAAPPAASAPPPPPAPPRVAAPPPPPPPPAPGRPTVPRAGAAPGSPVPPPAGSAAPPAAKKGKSPMFWVGVGCCGCLLLLVLIGGGCFATIWLGTTEPVAATRAELKAVKSADMDAAYQLLSSEYQQQVSRRAFEAFASRHPGLRENTDSTFMSRSVNGNTAHLVGVLTHAAGVEPIVVELVKENGSWKISSLKVGDDQL